MALARSLFGSVSLICECIADAVDPLDPPELSASSHAAAGHALWQKFRGPEMSVEPLLEPPVEPPVEPPLEPPPVFVLLVFTGAGACSGSSPPPPPPQAAIVSARIVSIQVFMMSSLVSV
jgi:hypothetical protein